MSSLIWLDDFTMVINFSLFRNSYNSLYLRETADVLTLLKYIGTVGPHTLLITRGQMRPAQQIIEEITTKIATEHDQLTLIENWGRGIGLASLEHVARKAAAAEQFPFPRQERFVKWATGEGAKLLLTLYVLKKLADL